MTSDTATPGAGTPDSTSTRLPRNVEPFRYELRLAPNLKKARFDGHVDIHVRILSSTDRIILNAADLTVSEVSLAGRSGTTITCTPSLDPESERLAVKLASPAAPGEWVLRIGFAGILNDKLHGFYRSVFTDAEGVENIIATTQFEATDARRAFPCWDEPDRKAVFAITLDVPSGLSAFSNSPVETEEELGGGVTRVVFADTVTMSTYLVAFVVGPLVATPPVDIRGVSLRVVHVPGKESLTAFALEIGAFALEYFADWFGIPYPCPKLDLLAIPDFAFGAMENMGAVTFRETALLCDPESASRVELERIADVVSHEIAHMWFGDLVTMRWWNGLWLNEAFATFAEMSCVDAFRPNWQRWVTFGQTKAAALATDELSMTRPIEFPVNRPEEAQGMFDILTYEKGAGVLRMLEQYLGTGVFLEGLRRYLDAHLFANAETTDLWDAIEDASAEPIRSVMDSWIFQGGHPLVTAELSGDGSVLSLSQEPFSSGPLRPSDQGGAIGSDWQVPVLVRTRTASSQESHRLLLGPDGAGIELTGNPDLVVVNAGGWGFYRTLYTGSLRDAVFSRLDELDPIELYSTVLDAWALAHAGRAPLSVFADLVAVLDSNDPNVWSTVANCLSFLDIVAAGDAGAASAVARFVREVMGPRLAKIGLEPVAGEDEKIGTLRANLFRALGTTGRDEDIRHRAAELFASAQKGEDSVTPDLAAAVASVVASAGRREDYDVFVERYRAPATPQEEMRFLFALPGFEDPSLFDTTLEMARTEVRTQNAPFVLQIALASRTQGERAWKFVTAHWDELTSKFPDGMIPRMVDTVSSLCTPDLAGDVHAFFADHPLRTGQRTLDQALERLDVNVAFARREGPGLASVLSSREG